MKSTLIIALGAALLIVIIGFFLFLGAQPNVPGAPSSNSNLFSSLFPFGNSSTGGRIKSPPSGTGTATGTLSVTLIDGRTVSIPDLTKIPQFEGHIPKMGYQVAGSNDTSFRIIYYKPVPGGTDFFVVSLLSEPLGETRRVAENELRALLGLSDAEICAIPDIQVWVHYSVNELFGDRNLGLSFCEGAVPLPGD